MNWASLPWKSWGAALAALLACAFFWNRDRSHLNSARMEAEAANLKLSGQIVSDQDSKQELQSSVAGLLEQNSLLREAYDKAVSAAPDAKPEFTAKLRTKSLPVAKVPEAVPVPDCDHPLVSDGRGGFSCPDSPPKAPPTPKTCALHESDMGSVEVDQIILRTRPGNKLITGVATFWRETPPRVKLLTGEFAALASDVDTLAAPAEPRWGAEGGVLCASSGCGLGVGVLLPPTRLLGLRWEPRVTAYSGPALAVSGLLGARW